MAYYQQDTTEVLEELEATTEGLKQSEAEKRVKEFGYNELADKEQVATWKLFLETFKDPMVIVLLAAAGIQILLGEIAESLIIFLVLIINSVISVIQTKKQKARSRHYGICQPRKRRSFGIAPIR